MTIQIINKPIKIDELRRTAENQFGDLVKAVVDTEKEVMAIGGELHADEEVVLFEEGSSRENTWGVNLYPEKYGGDWVEFDSMINIKPQYGNRSRYVEDEGARDRIKAIVDKLFTQ